jgi:hypothetical protein
VGITCHDDCVSDSPCDLAGDVRTCTPGNTWGDYSECASGECVDSTPALPKYCHGDPADFGDTTPVTNEWIDENFSGGDGIFDCEHLPTTNAITFDPSPAVPCGAVPDCCEVFCHADTATPAQCL